MLLSSTRFAVAALPGLLTLALCAVAAGESSRVWHVAQGELPGLPKDAVLASIAEAARRVEPGDTVLVHSGVYREGVVVERGGTAERPVRFMAAPGERVVVTGADRLAGITREEGEIYAAPWPHRFIGWSKTNAHPDDEYHRLIGRAEQVFVLGYPLRQVLRRSEMARGTFYVDLEAKRILLWSADGRDLTKNENLVEASVRPVLWECRADHVHLSGIRFRYAANHAQQGACQFKGKKCVVEDCVFERMNSSGASFLAEDLVVRRCVFQENGQIGFGANRAHRMLFTGCVVRGNNAKGFDRGWEAGGDKLVFCRGAVLEKSSFVENRGNGIWFDIGNEDCVVRNCLIADNEDCGIFYEISYGLRAHDNVIVGNGFAGTPGSWGAAAGISISSSPNCVIERNLIVGNKEGFNFREQHRKTPLIDDGAERWVWNHDETVRSNVLAFNRDAQTWGWFDIPDGRHWPEAMQEAKEKEAGRPAEDVADKYRAKDASGAPSGLSLEKLRFAFDGNLYFAAPGQGLFNWGVTWKRHKRYETLEEVQTELGLEKGSATGDPGFASAAARDFRVPAASAALRRGCYPKGEVPGVTLGVLRR